MNKLSLFLFENSPSLFDALDLEKSEIQMNEEGYLEFLSRFLSTILALEKQQAYERVLEYSDLLLTISEQSFIDIEKIKLEFAYYAHFNTTNAQSKLNAIDASCQSGKKAFEIAQLLSDDIKIGKISTNLGMMYQHANNVNESYKYFKISIDAGIRSNNIPILANAYDNLSTLYLGISDFANALASNELALIEYRKLQDHLSEARNIGAIGVIYYYMNDLDRAKEYFQIAYDECEKHQYKRGMSNWIGNIGNVHAERGEYDFALTQYSQAMNISIELKDDQKIGLWKGNIADLYFDMNKYDEAVPLYTEAIQTLEHYGEIVNALHFRCQYSRLFTLPNMNLLGVEDAKDYISHCLEMSITYGLKKEEYLSHSVLSSLYEKYQDWEKALHHHKEYVSIKQLVHSKEIEESARNFDFGRRLQKMEEERSLELARLHQKESMLHDLLPGGISDRIINGEELVAELYQDIAIMFCDIVGFTEISERLGPESTIRSLNTFYTSFDSIIQKHGIEKIKTIGDCYMAASGLFDRESDYIHNIMLCAAQILQLTTELTFIDGTPLQVRIGLHAGNAMAGVLGDKKYTFDVWGDTVNTSARMEAYGHPGAIQITESMMRSLNLSRLPQLQLWKEHMIQVKGKGEMKTALLTLVK